MQALYRWRRYGDVHSRPQTRPVLFLLVGLLFSVGLVLPARSSAGQGWWWGSPIDPGFDRNTVVQVTGTATQVDVGMRGGPCTLSLQTPSERFAVMLAPGWYLAEQRVDIRSGDTLVVEGSKMMDRRGQLHLVAARVINQRTGAVLQLRDDAGRPLWAAGKPAWKR